MTLAYATFRMEQYACLDPKLPCVSWWLEWEAACRTEDKARGEKALLTGATEAQKTVLSKLLPKIKALIPEVQDDPQKRRAALKALVDPLLAVSTRDMSLRHKLDRALLDILLLYSKFDESLFSEEFALGVSGRTPTDLPKVNGVLGQATKKKSALMEKVVDLFHGEVPSNWQGLRRLADDDGARREMGIKIVEAFISDWKRIAPLFSEPVTISGYAIRTLPPEMRKVWLTAYNQLDLGKLPKNVQYAYKVFRSEVMNG